MGLQALEASPREQVLEVGFGTGDALLSLAESVGAAGEVWGIDISTEMASVARQKLAQESPLAQVRLLCGDGLRLPLRSDCYDALFMSFTLELFDTPIMPNVLAECRRVLRHTGRLGIVSLSKSESPGLMERLYESAHRLLPRLVDCRPIFTRSVLEDAGFVIVDETRRRMWGLPVDIVVARCPG
jgi:demethylmenaquinone methyltransferase/2-methoxy-6-polyprenyl-1,4-benzoquinol methylase